jgi:hypothetical protein
LEPGEGCRALLFAHLWRDAQVFMEVSGPHDAMRTLPAAVAITGPIACESDGGPDDDPKDTAAPHFPD